jgi:hypothetical protein
MYGQQQWRQQPQRRRHRRVAVAASTVLVAAGLGVSGGQGANATVTGAGVTDGHSITVFHNIDMVSALGWTPGERISVHVIRNGVTIGRAAGPAVDPLGEGAGLEVNHGPEGTPRPGDCWDEVTPDIQPGDIVRVSNGSLTDEVTVDDLRFRGQPTVDGATGDVVVPVYAMRHDGSAFTAAELDGAEFRDGSDLRANSEDDPGFVQVHAVDAANGRFEVRYRYPFTFSRNRAGLRPEQVQEVLVANTAGHMFGFGHTEPPPADAQIIEGFGENTFPAAGCEDSPMARYAVTQTTPGALNLVNQEAGLTVSGVSHNTASVQVVLRTGTGEVTVDPVTPTPATGAQTWTAQVTSEQLAGLGDGLVTVAARYTDAVTGAIWTGRTRALVRDLVAPDPPSASLPGGSYLGRQDVSINAGPSALVRYTLGDGSQPAPTATTGSRYTGRQIMFTASQVLKMVAVDSAGNVSDVVTERYQITPRITPAPPRIGNADAEARRATVRWAPPAANGGPSVNGYRIRVYRRTELVRSVVVGPARRQHTVRGLANGHWHRFTVAARNSVGFGVESARSNVVTPRGAPARPRVRRATSGARGGTATASVRWAAPVSDGGRRITGYRVAALRMRSNGSVQARRVSRQLRPGAREVTMRLVRGRYRFQVRAANRLGDSRWSARSHVVRSR